jgi:hypothetical protein
MVNTALADLQDSSFRRMMEKRQKWRVSETTAALLSLKFVIETCFSQKKRRN